jgi:hypothetical protein
MRGKRAVHLHAHQSDELSRNNHRSRVPTGEDHAACRQCQPEAVPNVVGHMGMGGTT